MFPLIKSKPLAALALCLLTSPTFAAATDITGKWRNIDDKSGYTRGIVEITHNAQGSYDGKVVEITPRPGYTPQQSCKKCPGADRGKPILGLTIMHDIKRLGNTRDYQGKILDPISGKIYQCKIRMSESGNQLLLRGYMGIDMLGRTQTWLRQTP